jgi:hypothetical protein
MHQVPEPVLHVLETTRIKNLLESGCLACIGVETRAPCPAANGSSVGFMPADEQA